MIRKILLCIVLIYTAAWFSIAYTLKGNVVGLIKHSETDNIKITYSQASVSGFPARWHIKLLEPKIQLINGANSREFSAPAMTFAVHFSLKKASLNFGKEIKRQEIFPDKSTEYSIRSGEDIEFMIKFNKPLYKLSSTDKLESVIKALRLDNKSLSMIRQDKEVSSITDLALLINRIITAGNENISLQLRFLYTGQEEFWNFKKAKLDLATVVNIVADQSNREIVVKNFSVNHLNLVCDDHAALEMAGAIEFFQNKFPLGKLSFELTNYHDVVDKLMSNNPIIPKNMVKHLIEKAVKSSVSEDVKTDDGEISTYEKIKFDINFTDTGIQIGTVNLLELNFLHGQEPSN